MKTVISLAVIASLFALGVPDTGAEAKTIKYRAHRDRHHDKWKLSCNTARHMVRERGYHAVRIKSCISTVYSFRAVKNGRAYIIHVHSRTGSLWRG